MKLQSTTTLATALLLSSVANATVSNVSTPDCPAPGGAHIIVARASDEQEGYGIIGVVKDNVLAAVPGSTAEFVVYPATLGDYINSESDGVVAMRQLIDNFVADCEGSPLVVMGYSQGAQVTADSLVGQDDAAFPDNSTIDTPLSNDTLDRVAAVIMMGDPSFVTNESFHVGNATKNGYFPRRNIANFDLTGLASRTQSYCDYNDFYCATGSSIAVHVSYVGEYGAAAANYTVAKIAAWYGNATLNMGNNSSMPVPSKGVASMSGIATMSASASASRYAPSGTGIRSSGVPAPSGTGSGSPVTPSSPSTTSTTPNSPSSSSNSAASVSGALSGVFVSGLFAFLFL